MNKKGQAGPLAVIILLIAFVINWWIWLGAFVNEMGDNMIVTNNLTGVEAFFFSNLNLVIFIAMLLGTSAYLYFSQ